VDGANVLANRQTIAHLFSSHLGRAHICTV
jgi:hypothetical protein